MYHFHAHITRLMASNHTDAPVDLSCDFDCADEWHALGYLRDAVAETSSASSDFAFDLQYLTLNHPYWLTGKEIPPPNTVTSTYRAAKARLRPVPDDELVKHLFQDAPKGDFLEASIVPHMTYPHLDPARHRFVLVEALLHYGRRRATPFVASDLHGMAEVVHLNFPIRPAVYSDLNHWLGPESLLFEYLHWNDYRVWSLEQTLARNCVVDPLGDGEGVPVLDWLEGYGNHVALPNRRWQFGVLLA